MACDETLRVQAYLDGEVDAASIPAIERHLETCPTCQAVAETIQSTRMGLRNDASYYHPDAAYRRRLFEKLEREGLARGRPEGRAKREFGRRSFWTGAATGGLAASLAALLAFFFLIPGPSDSLPNEILNAHLRSMMANHLVDVVSSDHHTVKPWFSSHGDVSPPVADFTREGYRLVGGRADFIAGRRASAVVFRHGAHIINVFVWTDMGENLPAMRGRNGYHLVFWKSGNLDFCAISDTALDELIGLETLLKAMTIPDSRE
ncbi:MAG TPA: zf-HC2 domain-containing protein [Rhizomicrobium sp.]|jgi:anti-sigma factor RsiW